MGVEMMLDSLKTLYTSSQLIPFLKAGDKNRIYK